MKYNTANILILSTLLALASTLKEIDTFSILFPEAFQQSSGKSLELVTAQGGCFQWASSSPDIVSVAGLPSDKTDCYRKGLVQLKHVGPYPASVYITATNVQTQELSNIPVVIKPISRIEIIAKSKLMNIQQIQDLRIFAYDKDQNMFTSLEGLRFEWELVQNQKVLSKISLKNSHLILPLDERKNIEMKGAESDILVIRGDTPGKASVRVKCIEPGYEHLKHQIVVSVQQRFDIFPSLPTYVMVDSLFKFNLITPSRQEIAVPRSYYKTTLSSPKFTISETLNLKTPVTEDQAVLRVEDVRTVPAYSSEVTIYAKEPNAMIINVDEYLIVGESAKVSVQFMWDKHVLLGTNNNHLITSVLPYDHKTHTVTGKERTSATIKATYKNLIAEKKINVVLPLKQVLPSNKVVLPVDQSFQLKIVGGSGSYDYQIEGNIASISGSGVVSSKKEGHGKIIVIDKKVPRNRLSLDLVVSPVNILMPLQTNKELNVNEFGPIFTIAKTRNYEQFTKCSQQEILLETSHLHSFETSKNASFSTLIDLLNAKMAQSIIVKNTLMKSAVLPLGVDDLVSKFSSYVKAGDVSVQELRKYASQLQNYGICSAAWAKSYVKYDDQMEVYLKKNINVRNKFRLRVYEKIINDISKQAGDSFIMTPLASLNWKTVGGSYGWDSKTKTYLNSVQYHTEYPVVKCPQKQTVLEIRMQKINVQSTHLLLPVSQSKSIYVQCKYPSQLKIKFDGQTFDSNTVNGLKGQTIKGQLIPYDNKGQTFYNSSNLVYQFEKSAGSVLVKNDRFEFDSQSAKSAKVTFWTEIATGVNAKFNKVSTYFNYNANEMFELSPHPEQNHLLALYNPKSSYPFKLRKVSQNSQVYCDGAISCSYSTTTKQIRVNTTRLGQGILTVSDLSLYDYPSLKITFEVVDADEIILSVSQSSVEVQKKVTAQVNLYYQGKLIPAWQYDSRNLLVVHEAGIRSKEIVSADYSSASNTYQISTDKPGVYKVTAQQHHPRYLESSPITLKVYPKFSTNVPSLDHTYSVDNILQFKGQLTVAVNCFRKVQLYGGPDVITVTHQIEHDDYVQVKFDDTKLKQVEIVGLHEGKTKVSLTVTSAQQKSPQIAQIQLHVTVKPIDHATIYSLQDAVLDAQFRIIPYLIVDGNPMIDNVCDFEYKWTSDNHIKLQGLNKDRLGINATAVKEGEALINLQVIRNGKVLFSSTKEITVHKSLDIVLPTVIGHRQNAISANLLLPPNSGLNFDKDIYVTKISQRDSNILAVNQNRLITNRQKGMVPIKLQKTSDNTYNNYMNVIVTEIKGLFVENSYSQVFAEVGRTTQVKFYVQDAYGRLFYNNLFNVEYDVVSSNQDVCSVSIDSTKNFINISPKKQGQAQLILRLKSSQGASGMGKLLEIPHDIVKVSVGKVIEPRSPIYLAVGGEVSIQYTGKEGQKWKIISGQSHVQVDERARTIKALETGETVISIGGHQVIIRVLDVVIKQKVLQRPQPGKVQLVVEYIATGKWINEDIYFQSIQNTYNHINNHLNLTCVPLKSGWFTTTTQLIKTQNVDKLRCSTVMNNDITTFNEDLPQNLQVMIVSVDNKMRRSILHTNKEPIHSTFWVPKMFKTILLSPEKSAIQFFIRTPQKLRIDVVGGQQKWLEEKFDSENSVHAFQLIVQTEKKQNFEFKLRVSNSQTDQTEEINVRYITDETTRKAQQKRKQKEDHHDQTESEQAHKVQEGHGVMELFMGWHWTDFIIVLMALNFIGVLIWQAFSNGDRKYHTL